MTKLDFLATFLLLSAVSGVGVLALLAMRVLRPRRRHGRVCSEPGCVWCRGWRRRWGGR